MKSFMPSIVSSSSALAIAGGVMLAPSTSFAAETQGYHGVNLGLTLSFSVGARPAFGVGADLRYSYFVEDTTSTAIGYYGAGPFLQASWLRGGAGRFAFGAHGGPVFSRIVNADAELGLTYRTGYRWPDAAKRDVFQEPDSSGKYDSGGLGLHIGFSPQFNALLFEHGPVVRGSIGFKREVKNELTLGWEFRAPGPCFVYRCPINTGGRPLRSEMDAEPILGSLRIRRADPNASRHRVTSMDVHTRRRLASHWARDTRAECASIPAFFAIARDLARAGAPESLIRHALRSAAEEAHHTELCATITNQYLPFDVIALEPEVPTAKDVDRMALLERLALESFWDGCVGEGTAAAQALRVSQMATNDRIRQTLAIIARDEAAHAELSERIVAFCISAGGKSIRDALARSVEERMSDEESAIDAMGVDGTIEFDETLAYRSGVPNAMVRQNAREQALAWSIRLVA
ncbi:MAG: hypothetical protein IPM54_16755 [Polyangiaceae bacterium]|nr:hypothetical protein [Polyangiaceae bacterium]